MKVNYNDISLSHHQKARYAVTIEQNSFIPSNKILKTKLYPKQIYANTYENPDPDDITRKLIGGSAYSGKSHYGASSASQDFESEDYRCLVLRRTYDDVIATGGIIDKLTKWFKPYMVDNGGFIEHNEKKKVFINKDVDARIYYNYMMYLKDRKKFKSRGYHKIIVDEASELLKENLQFLNRSARDSEDSDLPIIIEYISNPDSSSGIEFLDETFVKGPLPYFEMNFWDNLFINIKRYYNTLKYLSKADFQYQMGNWDYEIASGDIFDNDMIIAATISYEAYQEFAARNKILFNSRMWDIAASETKTANYTANTLFEAYRGNVHFCLQQESVKKLPGKLENYIHKVMGLDEDEGVQQKIEFQPAAAGKIMARYWRKEFKQYKPKFVRVIKNKLVRAGKVVPCLKNAALALAGKNYDRNIPRIYFVENPKQPYLKKFTRQAVNFPTERTSDNTESDDEMFKNDRIDNLSLYTQIIMSKKTSLSDLKRGR